MTTVLSVDGQDGATLARSSGIRFVQDESQAVVLRNQEQVTRDGRPGSHAPQAIRGGPAGTLVVQLSESNLSQGAIRIQRRENRSAHHLPEITEVPVGRDIRLTAIGGKGEAGKNGGNGQRGFNGENGTSASEADDATDGTNGGRGGDAGRGSSGGDGGSGGDIHIIMNEDNTHLLMAVSCDVSGGEGGTAGKHGTPGAGGTGGKGGQGWRWQRIVGYKPFCTDSCIKNNQTAGSSNALARTSTHLSASTNALRAQTQALVVRGNNVQAIIAQAAIKYRAMQQPSTGAGYCKCGGGTGSCQGCDVKPIWTTLTRAPGLDGRDGEKGKSIITPLFSGKKGGVGTVTIVVRHHDGSMQEYSAPWSLELVDFEVEDENGDGVFEPGEHIFIRRIKVRNVGGMPSPTCRIPVTLADNSEWFGTVPMREGGFAYLPTSIPAGESASTTGSIKVRIKNREHGNTQSPALGVRFSAKDTLRLRADMPWMDRKMPFFDFAKEISISYPCGLSGFQHLSTIAQGAVSMVKYKVDNMCNRPLGGSEDPSSGRTLQVRMTIPRDFGRLYAKEEEEEEHYEVMRAVPCTRPQDSLQMLQQFRVLSKARSHKHFPITFELWLESPNQDPNSEMLEEVLVERHTIRLQVSNTYRRTENANLLLITNPNTTERQSLAIQTFVRNTLGMDMDVCNIHQNGGLLNPRENDLDDPLPLISAYRDKTILILDNPFTFFDAGSRTTSELCDPQWLTELAISGTSTLFIGCEAGNAFEEIARSSILPLPVTLQDAVKQIPRSRLFSTKQELVHSIIQEKQFGPARVGASAIPLQPTKWYRFGRDKAVRQAKKLVEYLQSQLPNERFLVTYAASKLQLPRRRDLAANEDVMDTQINAARGSLLVLTGLDHYRSIVSTESSITVNPDSNRLHALGRYNIIASLPSRQRILLLWRNAYSDSFVTKALILSVVRDMFHQLTGFRPSAHRLLSETDTADMKVIDILLKTHLPCLNDLLSQEQARLLTPAPDSIQEILQWVLSFTTPQRRLNTLVRSTIANRYSTQHLKDYAPPSSLNTGALMEKISRLTETPENVFTRGQISATDVVPRTIFCAPQEWDSMVRGVGMWRERMRSDMEGAQRQLGKMLVDIQLREGLNREETAVSELSAQVVELEDGRQS